MKKVQELAGQGQSLLHSAGQNLHMLTSQSACPSFVKLKIITYYILLVET